MVAQDDGIPEDKEGSDLGSDPTNRQSEGSTLDARMREIRSKEEEDAERLRNQQMKASDVQLEEFGQWKMGKFKSYAREILL